MMKDAQRLRTTSDMERRRMGVIQTKINNFLDNLPDWHEDNMTGDAR